MTSWRLHIFLEYWTHRSSLPKVKETLCGNSKRLFSETQRGSFRYRARAYVTFVTYITAGSSLYMFGSHSSHSPSKSRYWIQSQLNTQKQCKDVYFGLASDLATYTSQRGFCCIINGQLICQLMSARYSGAGFLLDNVLLILMVLF